ncbi:BURP domain-containing protein 6 isoform X2 [Elaeis guineensis]|uniref:BURP domain-containing protein 6 isoform X2 n=1 Tax=Elaeis guineensis var. tenera TaxID=51953 RepID=UPI003C6D2825
MMLVVLLRGEPLDSSINPSQMYWHSMCTSFSSYLLSFSVPLLVSSSMACFLVFLLFFLVAVEAYHAALPADVYWKSVLPNTPMPSAIHDVTRPDEKWDQQDDVFAHYGHAAVTPSQIPDPSVTVFFLEKDLHPGAKMTLHFIRTVAGATLLPRQAADSIPFSSAKLPEILSRLSITPYSMEAKAMKKTLQDCEEPAIEGETKYCATSVEAMVDFSTSSLGTRDVQALSTAVDREGTPTQVYSISKVQKQPSSKAVVCHGEKYPYAVFYCHTTSAEAFKVSMVAKDGTKVEGVATCHTDTAGYNPEHVAFKLLHVKPGTVPICHFLPQSDIVWIPNK